MLSHDERRVVSLWEELADVASLHDLDFVLRDVATMTLGASRARLWMVDQGLVRLVDRHQERSLDIATSTSLITQVVTTREPQWSPQCKLAGSGDPVRAACVLPLLHGDTTLGVLAFAFPTEHYFANAERELLLGVAAHVATALLRLRPPTRWAKASSQIEILAGPREVLIVDDDAYDAASLRDTINQLAYQPLVAYNAAAALRIAEQVVAPIAFVSLGMSTSDGFQIARQLREMPEWSSTRIIAIAANERGNARVRAREASFDELLLRPFSAETVQALLPES